MKKPPDLQLPGMRNQSAGRLWNCYDWKLKVTPPLPLKNSDTLEDVDFNAGAVLLVDKPSGITSFGVVRQVRKLTGVKKVGHAGTLDPAATGLLIILTGKSTRRQDAFSGQDKEYLATIRLGIETTTWDMDGEVIETKPVLNLERRHLAELLTEHFTGEIDQIPPAFSAIKKQGIPSYRLARKGERVELEPRRVSLYRADIVEWNPPDFTLRICCSSGFYVRSLAHDIGKTLGCGGTLSRLIRTKIGDYRLEEAFELAELRERIR